MTRFPESMTSCRTRGGPPCGTTRNSRRLHVGRTVARAPPPRVPTRVSPRGHVDREATQSDSWLDTRGPRTSRVDVRLVHKRSRRLRKSRAAMRRDACYAYVSTYVLGALVFLRRHLSSMIVIDDLYRIHAVTRHWSYTESSCLRNEFRWMCRWAISFGMGIYATKRNYRPMKGIRRIIRILTSCVVIKFAK